MTTSSDIETQIRLFNAILRLEEKLDRTEERIDRRFDQLEGRIARIEDAIHDIRDHRQRNSSRSIDFDRSQKDSIPEKEELETLNW